MIPSVSEFVAEHSQKIIGLKGGNEFLGHFASCKTSVDNGVLSSHLLSNHYGSVVDESLGLFYRSWVRTKMEGQCA